jgi:hypothetical protein
MDRRGGHLNNIFPSFGLQTNHCRALLRSLKQEALNLHELHDGFGN